MHIGRTYDAGVGDELHRPQSAREDRQPRARGEDRGRGVHQRSAPLAQPRGLDGLRGASRVHARRRPAPHRLAALRPQRSLLRERVRGRHEHESSARARHVRLDGVRERRHLEAPVREVSRILPRLLLEPAARPDRPGDVRGRHRRLRAARRPSTCRSCSRRLPGRRRTGAAVSTRRCARSPSTRGAGRSW